MNRFLDKSYTVRQVWRWTRRMIYVAILLYIVAVFLHAWNMKIGGVSLNDSPFKEQIPQHCIGYAEKSFGAPAGRTLKDEFLLRERIRRYRISPNLLSASQLIPCLGYAVLGGLHDKTPGDANFTEQFLDADGDIVVTIRVEYGKSYTTKFEDKK